MKQKKNKSSFRLSMSRHAPAILQHKPLMLTVIFALVIGVIFGIFILQLTKQAGPVSQMEKLEEVQQERPEADMQKVDGLSFYVIQGGVFSNKENADKAAKAFQAANVSAMQWETEEGIYLFAGIAAAEAVAKESAGKMKDADLEVYVKPWEIGAVQAPLTEYEHKWLLQFMETWQAALEQGSEEEKQLTEEWQGLLKTEEQSDHTSLELIGQLQEKIEASSGISQMELLKLIYTYEKAF